MTILCKSSYPDKLGQTEGGGSQGNAHPWGLEKVIKTFGHMWFGVKHFSPRRKIKWCKSIFMYFGKREFGYIK